LVRDILKALLLGVSLMGPLAAIICIGSVGLKALIIHEDDVDDFINELN
jgi:hypothetical protein